MRGRKDRPPRRWKKVERFDVRNQKKVWHVAEEEREGSWASRVRKGEATVGCQELAGRERKRRTTKRYLTFSFKVKMALGSAEQGGKAWQERPAVKAVEEG